MSYKLPITIYPENLEKINGLPPLLKGKVINKIIELFWDKAMDHSSVKGILSKPPKVIKERTKRVGVRESHAYGGRRKALTELTQLSQELGMYDE